MELTHIALFAGIGGDTLAAQWAGFRTVLFVENDHFCQKVLRKHWPDVPIIGDIRDVREETLVNTQNWQQSQLKEGDNASNTQERHSLRTSNRSGSRNIAAGIKGRRGATKAVSSTAAIPPITLITGGFPCQPVSVAGERRGKDDDRWLWPEMLTVISIVRPTWVVAENVTGLLQMGFYDCLSDLEGQGYETSSLVIPACGVNAPHRRDRIFIVGYTNNRRCQRCKQLGGLVYHKEQDSKEAKQEQENESQSGIKKICQDVVNTNSARLQGRSSTRNTRSKGENRNTFTGGCCDGSEQWAVEPDVGRVAYGIPSRVDRLKGLGNAIVPQQIYPILKGIAEIEGRFVSYPVLVGE